MHVFLMALIIFLNLFQSAAVANTGTGTETLVIERQSGASAVSVNIDIAKDEHTREKGLMFLKSIPENYGMLFVSDIPQIQNFWMKNTYIHLDMIFIRSDGIIVKIHENSVPHSLNIVSSDIPVLAVLEVQGGFTKKHTVTTGDKVLHTLFSQH